MRFQMQNPQMQNPTTTKQSRYRQVRRGPSFLTLEVRCCSMVWLHLNWLACLGRFLALCGFVVWFRDVLPQEKHESFAMALADPVSINRPEVAEVHRITGQRHRTILPIEIYPFSAGIKGGLGGGVVMTLVAVIWGLLTRHGIWYPLN